MHRDDTVIVNNVKGCVERIKSTNGALPKEQNEALTAIITACTFQSNGNISNRKVSYSYIKLPVRKRIRKTFLYMKL